MAEGRLAREWDHTSQILAMLANVNRDPKRSKPILPSTFHPFLSAKRKRKGKTIQSIHELKALLP